MESRSILPAMWKIPQILRDRLGASAGRQRAMVAEDHLLLVLHAPPKPEDTERKGRFYWRQPDGTWSSSEGGGGVNALDRHLAEYEELVEEYDGDAENATSANDYFNVLDALSPLHRASRHLHQVMQEARQLCREDRDIINLRDQAYNLERNSDLLYEGIKNSLDVAVARRAEEQAKASHQMAVSAHRLNVLAAIFFPIATLSAIFGVNLDHGYEHAFVPYPFFILVALGLFSGLVLMSYITNSANGRVKD